MNAMFMSSMLLLLLSECRILWKSLICKLCTSAIHVEYPFLEIVKIPWENNLVYAMKTWQSRSHLEALKAHDQTYMQCHKSDRATAYWVFWTCLLLLVQSYLRFNMIGIVNPVTIYHSSVLVASRLWSHVTGTDGSRAACHKVTWSVYLVQV